MNAGKILIPFATVLLASCATPPESAGTASAPEPERAQVRVLSEAEVYTGLQPADRQRIVADLLYEGLQALDADRLLTPVDNNAHARFRRALAYDPDNEIALQGLQDIVLRYVELAEEAIYQGLFDQAQLMLERARFVDESHPAIAAMTETLADEQDSGDLFYDFEANGIVSQSEAAQTRLADIAQTARDNEAFFLITAPNDAHARWMYSVMREAVAGYRLRGNIELASRYSIRLRMPDQNS